MVNKTKYLMGEKVADLIRFQKDNRFFSAPKLTFNKKLRRRSKSMKECRGTFLMELRVGRR